MIQSGDKSQTIDSLKRQFANQLQPGNSFETRAIKREDCSDYLFKSAGELKQFLISEAITTGFVVDSSMLYKNKTKLTSSQRTMIAKSSASLRNFKTELTNLLFPTQRTLLI